jgi:ammonia channel protein AmtB
MDGFTTQIEMAFWCLGRRGKTIMAPSTRATSSASPSLGAVVLFAAVCGFNAGSCENPGAAPARHHAAHGRDFADMDA